MNKKMQANFRLHQTVEKVQRKLGFFDSLEVATSSNFSGEPDAKEQPTQKREGASRKRNMNYNSIMRTA